MVQILRRNLELAMGSRHYTILYMFLHIYIGTRTPKIIKSSDKESYHIAFTESQHRNIMTLIRCWSHLMTTSTVCHNSSLACYTEPVVLDNCWDLIPQRNWVGIGSFGEMAKELVLTLHCQVLVTGGDTERRTKPTPTPNNYYHQYYYLPLDVSGINFFLCSFNK
jgi:hypothetical protein